MPSDFFKDKVAIVTGASSGIGLETARLLDRRGSKVVLAARRKDALDRAAQGFRQAMTVVTDVRDDQSVEDLAQETLRRFGRIDILVNCAGVLLHRPMAETTLEEAREVMETDFFGAVRAVNAVLPAMRRQGSGHIANIASISGRIGFPNLGYYASAKFALVGFSETLRQELRPLNIFVTAVNPGTVRTPMAEPHIERALKRGKRIFPSSPAKVAAVVLDAVEARKAEVFTPLSTRFLYVLHFFLPSVAEWLAWKFRSSDPEAFKR